MQLDVVNNSQPGNLPVQVNPSNENRSKKVSGVVNEALSNGQESELVLSENKLENKTSRLWNCIGATKNPGGGSLYTFMMHPGFDINHSDCSDDKLREVYQIFSELGPATEPISDMEFFQNLSEQVNTPQFKQLGYRIEKNSEGLWEITLPSRKALLNNWKKLRETNPNLPDFKIHGADGIAGHLEFVKAYLKNDVLLSKNKEFIHDQMFHVLPTIKFILDEQENYPDRKKDLVNNINTYFERITSIKANSSNLDRNHSLTSQQVELLEIALGIITDLASSQNNFYTSESCTKEYLENLKNPFWNSYVLKNSGNEQLNKDTEFDETLVSKLNEAWYKAIMATAPIFGYPRRSDVDGFLKNNPGQFLITDKALCVLFVIEEKEHLIEIPYELTENENGYKLVVNYKNKIIEKELETKLIPEGVMIELKEIIDKEVNKTTDKLNVLKKELEQPDYLLRKIPPGLLKQGRYIELESGVASIVQITPYHSVLDFHPGVKDLEAGFHYSLYDHEDNVVEGFIVAENIQSFSEKLKQLPESQLSRTRLFSQK